MLNINEAKKKHRFHNHNRNDLENEKRDSSAAINISTTLEQIKKIPFIYLLFFLLLFISIKFSNRTMTFASQCHKFY